MPKFAIDQAKKFMRNPFEFRLSNDQLTLDGIQQYHVNVGNEEGKFLTLQELYPLLKQARGICFCNTRNRAKRLEERMAEQGHDVPGMVMSKYSMKTCYGFVNVFELDSEDRYHGSSR